MTKKEWIVVKVTKNQIVLMNINEGTFKNIHRSSTQFPLIGERFEYTEQKTVHLRFVKIASIACMLMLVVLYFRFFNFNVGSPNTTYLIAIDINPSMEIYVDKNMKISSINALNKDAENVINEITYKGKDFSYALELIIDQCAQQNYLRKNKAGLIATTIIDLQKSNKLNEFQMKDIINASLSKHQISADINISTGGKDILEEAHKSMISINKYRIYKELKNKGEKITLEEVKNKLIKDLLVLEDDKNYKNKSEIDKNSETTNNHDEKESNINNKNEIEQITPSKPVNENRNKTDLTQNNEDKEKSQPEKTDIKNNRNNEEPDTSTNSGENSKENDNKDWTTKKREDNNSINIVTSTNEPSNSYSGNEDSTTEKNYDSDSTSIVTSTNEPSNSHSGNEDSTTEKNYDSDSTSIVTSTSEPPNPESNNNLTNEKENSKIEKNGDANQNNGSDTENYLSGD